ncbi:hypothetical protein IWQ56_005859 [Coemansia nantahalensis]|uniref:Uncharacterized protein n=1 Tax=Coemansia nantahalensis TaxID=2789366 RepID=A0ACC1JX71_9FUNG|nr:hypothetical protein IWQ56_005859 [Coemansia nantahalensis]KAJ2769121.1 hypothetical protein IWQ57_003242 [Coemansia nantahalensis]
MPFVQPRSDAAERVLASAQFINARSSDVSVPEDGVRQAAQEIMGQMTRTGYSTAEWKKHALLPSVADSAALEWIFVADALNFSFWPTRARREEQYTVTLDGVAYRGYWSLCAAINRALREGIDMTDAQCLADMTLERLAHVFRTDDPRTQEPIPMLDDRLQVVREAGQVLLAKYGGRFANVVAECAGSAQRLVELVVRDFASFRDEHQFAGQTVCLYKRAQILVADVWACFEGRGLGCFDDIDHITMFADYRVPQALCHFGALQYSPRLRAHLEQSEAAVRRGDAPDMLPSGHPWEVEIRGNSIWAVQRIRQHILDAGTSVNAILLDFYLWDYAKEHAADMSAIPIHHTRSIFY